LYARQSALEAVDEHAQHFLEGRKAQILKLTGVLERPPIVVCPYDAELFGHWWYEGPEFLDSFVRKACLEGQSFTLITPDDYLCRHPKLQVARPAASSWGEEGYWGVWLNEQNEWIYPHVSAAQERMTALAGRLPNTTAVEERALKQAGRELLLAQASDWPFMMRTGTSTNYARKQITEHLLRFTELFEQISAKTIYEETLTKTEAEDNIFPEVDYRYWAAKP